MCSDRRSQRGALACSPPPTLRAHRSRCRDDRTLIICDIEGAECDLLDPARATGLRRAVIIVELHDFLRGGTTELLRDRFQPSHQISIVDTAARNPGSYRQLDGWMSEDARMALDEARIAPGGGTVHQQWACLTPLA